MSKPARRGGSINWYYRESTPADIRDLLTQRGERAPKEVWVTLDTADIRLAKVKLVQVQADQHLKWDAMRQAAKPIGGMPSSADLTEAVVEFVHNRFIEVHRRNLRDKLEAGLVDPSSEAKRRRDKIVQAELFPTSNDHAEMELVAGALCREVGWDLGPSVGLRGKRWNELVGLITKAIQYARSKIVETLEGRPVADDREAVMAHLGGKRRPKAKAGETILELFALYETDSLRDGKSSDTLASERKVIGHFASFVGSDRSVADIGRTDIREFKRVLSRVPHRWITRPELKGMSIADAASHWEKLGGQGRSTRTVAKELSGISSFFVWLFDNAYIDDENPTIGFIPRFDKSKTKYPPYKPAQLQTVFGSPLFTGCVADKPHLAGATRVRDWRYWLPLCALYSGARAGEIAQLLCADVRQEQGVWVFDFNEEGSTGKSLKTRSSRRIVPVHPALFRLGFIDHLTRMLEAGHAQLFPEIEAGPRGDMSYRPSKFWQRYLKNLGVKERGLGLHSFRHGFADECRRNGVSKEVLQALMGHSDGSMSGHYGTIPWGTLVERKAAIEALSYGGLHDPLADEEVSVAA
ncbi:MAG TPA: site-specific integrase [Sphingomicrobium sp.]|nr:site-specific integrase [Sphingomicrobium sp.]